MAGGQPTGDCLNQPDCPNSAPSQRKPDIPQRLTTTNQLQP